MSKKQSFKEKCYKDKQGNIVLGQPPNLPLKTAVGSLIIGLFFTSGVVSEFVEILTFGAFFTFAWLELFQGVNYFRRLSGLIILALLFSSKLF